MTLDEWMYGPMPNASTWRRIARETMREVIGVLTDAAPDVMSDKEATIERVDAAYPFGERARHPYKAWLAERRLLISVLHPPDQATLPSADEAAACEVARDAVLEGRIDDACKLLEQAPNRLARRCPECGSPPMISCSDLSLPVEFAAGGFGAMLVPHHARLVGHLDAGPLFSARTPTDDEEGSRP